LLASFISPIGPAVSINLGAQEASHRLSRRPRSS
jgi:hypothetical protein